MASNLNFLSQINEKYSGAFKTEEGILLGKLAFCQGEPVDFVFLEASDEVEKHWGVAKETFLHRKMMESFPDTEDDWLMRFVDVVESGKSLRFQQYSHVLSKWFDVFTYPVGKDGKFVVLFSDVTDDKLAVQCHKESLEKYKTLFETIDRGFCIVEVLFQGDRPIDGLILETNPTFQEYTGLSNIEGVRVKELIKVDDIWLQMFARVTNTGKSARFVRYSKTLGGRWYDIGLFKLGSGDSRRVACLLQDVSERKRTVEQLNRQNSILQAINRVYQQSIICKTVEEFSSSCLGIIESATKSKLSLIAEVNDGGFLDTIAISDTSWSACKMQGAPQDKKLPPRGLFGTVVKRGVCVLSNDPAPTMIV